MGLCERCVSFMSLCLYIWVCTLCLCVLVYVMCLSLHVSVVCLYIFVHVVCVYVVCLRVSASDACVYLYCVFVRCACLCVSVCDAVSMGVLCYPFVYVFLTVCLSMSPGVCMELCLWHACLCIWGFT